MPTEREGKVALLEPSKNTADDFTAKVLRQRFNHLSFARPQSTQRVIQHAKSKKPAWLLAAAPFVWAPPNAPGPQDEEDYEEEDYEDDDEEDEEEDIRSAMMLVMLRLTGGAEET